MNPLIARMTGKRVQEDVPVPVGIPRAKSERERRAVQRRTAAAAMLGLGEAEGEDDESIIPDDAQEIENIAGPSGIQVDDKKVKKDQEPAEPDSPSEIPGSEEDALLTPRDALVAPDVTPQALEPLDAGDVPQARSQSQVPRTVPSQAQGQSEVNPMDVLLGRTSTRPSRPEPEPEHVVTAEAAQATVNAVLNVGGVSGNGLLKQGQSMPDPAPGQAGKIMEAFDRYGPKRTWNI